MRFKTLFVFLMISLGLSAQEYDVADYAGRPGTAEGSEMLPKGKMMWEAAVDYAHFKEDGLSMDIWALHNSLLRYGLTSSTEVYAGFSLLHGEVGDSEWKTGIGLVNVGGKFRICEKNGWIPEAAFVAKLTLPIGVEEFRSKEILPSMHLAFAHTLTDRIDLGYDFGLEWDGECAKPVTAANLWTIFNLTSRFGIYAETVNYFRKHDKPDFNVGLGCTWKLNKRIVFDVMGQFDCRKGINDCGVSAGFCWLIL